MYICDSWYMLYVLVDCQRAADCRLRRTTRINCLIRVYTLLPPDDEGRDSSVGIANGYGLDGPGIKSHWGRNFSYTSRPALRPTQPPVQKVPVLSRW
jgi:hypothetical protein